MPFEKGNTHGSKGRLFDGALRRAIAQDDGKRLRAAAEQLLNAAAEGEPWAINTLADRLDGKAPQSVSVEHKRDVEGLSLGELRDRIAEMLGGTGPAPASTDTPRGVH